MLASISFAEKSAAASEEKEMTSNPGGSPTELMSCPVLSTSIALRAPPLRISVVRITVIEENSSSKSAQFPLTIVLAPWTPGPAMRHRPAGRKQGKGALPFPPEPRGEADRPHTILDATEVALFVGNWPEPNTSPRTVKGNVRETW